MLVQKILGFHIGENRSFGKTELGRLRKGVEIILERDKHKDAKV
jgi:hypothetical protein